MAKAAHLKERFAEVIASEKIKPSGNSTISANTSMSNTDNMDLESIMKASQSLSEEIKLDKLIVSLMGIVFENAGAQHGALIMQENKKWMIQAIGKPGALSILPELSINDSDEKGNTNLPVTYINYILKTKEFSVIGNALESNFKNDPYFIRNQSKSVLCAPLLNKGKLVGVIYLENNLTTDTFTPERIDTLNLLSSQIAISLENASLYNNLEEKVKERTQEVMLQKDIIEKKNKSITDSINYAKRIQEAVLPDINRIRSQVSDVFVYFKPRDIVSGDFYWFGEKEEKLFLAAVDCTGHGVPGGFMSMVGHTLIQQIVFERGITDAGEILTQLNKSIRKELKQDSGTNKDGMDLALIIIDKKNKTIEFAGAKNPLILIQNNDIQHIRGDKFPIGGSEHGKDHTYTKHSFPIDENTYVYLYSDGYEDQLGGPLGRKFGRARMLEMLLQNHTLPFTEQKDLYAETHVKWKQKENQLDDLLLIGLKI
jgi:histidine kinase